MDNNTFELNRSFVRELTETYYDEQIFSQKASQELGYKTDKLFSLRRIQGHIKRLIEVSFWASVKKEEGRHHPFALEYSSPERETFPNEQVVFNEPLEFSAEIISKIAPALESTQRIGVWSKTVRGGKDELEIWGFTLPLKYPSLMVKAIEPGRIILTISDYWKARISDKAQIVDLDEYQNLFSGLGPPPPGEIDEAEKIVISERIPDLEKIALAMRAHGHGGTLLIIPDSNNTWSKSIDKGSFRFNPYEKFKEDLERRDLAIRQFVSGRINHDFHSSVERMTQSIKSIAQFTAVDGATLITPDRALLGFGAKIKISEELPDEKYNVEILKPFCGSKPDNKNLSQLTWGTRHKSAARFVFHQNDTVAIVASADGRLSVFKRDGEKISALQEAEFLWL
jgi:hypothetical protein